MYSRLLWCFRLADAWTWAATTRSLSIPAAVLLDRPRATADVRQARDRQGSVSEARSAPRAAAVRTRLLAVAQPATTALAAVMAEQSLPVARPVMARGSDSQVPPVMGTRRATSSNRAET